MLQYPFDYVKSNHNKSTHVFFMSSNKILTKNEIKYVISLTKTKKYFNRAILNKISKEIICLPNRNYIRFKGDSPTSISCGIEFINF